MIGSAKLQFSPLVFKINYFLHTLVKQASNCSQKTFLSNRCLALRSSFQTIMLFMSLRFRQLHLFLYMIKEILLYLSRGFYAHWPNIFLNLCFFGDSMKIWNKNCLKYEFQLTRIVKRLVWGKNSWPARGYSTPQRFISDKLQVEFK